MFGIGAGVMPYTMYDYMSAQNMYDASQQATQEKDDDVVEEPVIDEPISQAEEPVVEEEEI
jgi:hypothetical protein